MDEDPWAAPVTRLLPNAPPSRHAEILGQTVRRQIYEDIQAHPGETYGAIKRNLSLSNGGLTHHLQVLERGGLVGSNSGRGRRTLYSLEGRRPLPNGDRHRIQDGMLRVLAEAASASVLDMAERLDISRQLATYHVRLLAREGLVRLERRENRLGAVLATAARPTVALTLRVPEDVPLGRRAVLRMRASVPVVREETWPPLSGGNENDGFGPGDERRGPTSDAAGVSPKPVIAAWQRGRLRAGAEGSGGGDATGL
jgi:DNA-binding transcriptional ArsR family regulator